MKADDGNVDIVIEELLKEYNQADTDIDKANLLRKLVVESSYIDTKTAKAYLRTLEELSESTLNPAVYARLYNSRAALAYVNSKPIDTIHYWLDKTLDILRKNEVNDIEFEIAVISNKAVTYTKSKNLNLAIQEYTTGLKILSQQEERLYALETLFYSNIGEMMIHANRYDEGLEFIQKAEESKKLEFKKNGKVSELFEYLPIVKAELLYKLGRLDESEETLETVLALKNKTNRTNNYGKILLGEIYVNNHKSELGYPLLTEGLKEAIILDLAIDNQVTANLNLAKFELSQNNVNSALQNADNIFALYQKTGDKIDNSEIHKVMAEILERSGKFEESVEHYKSFQKLKEEELALESNLKFVEFQQKLSDTEKQYQINELEITQKLQDSKISILIIGFLLSIFLVFFIYYLYTKKEEHNKKLVQKNIEITIAKDRALMAAKAKKNFLSTMSHEMRTPMNAILGITNILLDENSCKEQKKHLTNLKFSSEGLLHVINEVLDFSKIEASKLRVIKKEFNLQQNLDSVINSLRHGCNSKHVKIIQDQNLSELENLIFGDKKRINQILTNLLGNAIKFTSTGHIVLRTKIKEHTESTIQVVFQVEDTGIGIPADKLESIFESFSQVNNEINRIHQGTGLGLGISKSLVELQGGKLSVKSIEGKGSTFSFTLKFEKRELILNQPTIRTATQIYKIGLEGKRILLVEDNKLNQLVALKVLEKFKVETALAENGQEALDMVLNNHFDLILMDIHMPIMDGIEATETIRAIEDPRINSIPIVALSADAYSDKVIAATQSGMNDYLSKPFKPEELFQKISNNLQGTKNAAC